MLSLSHIPASPPLAVFGTVTWLGQRSRSPTAIPGPAWGKILARIRAPSFPAPDFALTRLRRPSANGDHDGTAAFRSAIAACHEAGGGRVVVPAGDLLTGPVPFAEQRQLALGGRRHHPLQHRSERLSAAVLTRFEGNELMNYSPLVYAFEQENIAITGEGTLDGQAETTHWWPWKGGRRARTSAPTAGARLALLRQMGEDNVPVAQRVFGDGHYLRPNFVQPYRCRNVLIEGITFRTRRCGCSIQCSARTSLSAESRSSVTGRTTTAAIPNRAATC